VTGSVPGSQIGGRSAKDIPSLGLGDMVRFSKLLVDRYGLHFSDSRRTELEHGIRHAFASSACATLDEFYNLLVGAQRGSVEMDLLVNAVTVSETHFFRDAAQFNALATSILPEIIKRKTSLRTLRIWSAGCASGEEPYSIAMLLRDVVPDIETWSITILATDINTTLLERAHVGSYGPWAFREDRALTMRARYFQPNENRFELSPQIRRMVTFGRLNLAESQYPSFETNTMMLDLIICRNVTIYFPEAVTRQVVGRFHSALVDGGWLIVGHSEPSLEIYRQFQPRNFPDTVVYQRDDSAPPQGAPFVFPLIQSPSAPLQRSASQPTPTVPRPVLIPKISPEPPAPVVKEEKPEEILERVRELLEFGRDQEAQILLEKLLRTAPHNAQVQVLLGQVHANRGDWTEAEKYCRRAVEIDKLTLPAYYTLGLVLQHQGKLGEAVDMLKKVVYLERNHILGHYTLAGLYREQGLFPNAQKSLENALNLLRGLEADEVLAGSGGITVSRLRDAIVRQQQTLNKI
jgi:chemotaxis protein methyltransferase CheR